jgi:hypothetical protein
MMNDLVRHNENCRIEFQLMQSLRRQFDLASRGLLCLLLKGGRLTDRLGKSWSRR